MFVEEKRTQKRRLALVTRQKHFESGKTQERPSKRGRLRKSEETEKGEEPKKESEAVCLSRHKGQYLRGFIE